MGWLLSLLGWGIVGLVMAIEGVSSRGDTWQMHLAPGLRFWLPWAIATPLVFRFVARIPIQRERWRLAIPAHLIACVAISLAIHLWKRSFPSLGVPPEPPPRAEGSPEFMDRGPRRPPPRREPGSRPLIDLLHYLSQELPLYLAIVTTAHAWYYFQRDRELTLNLAQARLEALRAQLQPHFLFNTLNTIAELIHEEPNKAESMLQALGDLLRCGLNSGSQQWISFSSEVDLAKKYLILMQVRFEERLRFEFDIAPEAEQAAVPVMLLQPLIENAIEHGIQPSPAGGCIRVSAQCKVNRLQIQVSDDGVGFDPGKSPVEGIGLGNTRARLNELYQGRAQLTLHRGDCTTVYLLIPYRRHHLPQ